MKENISDLIKLSALIVGVLALLTIHSLSKFNENKKDVNRIYEGESLYLVRNNKGIYADIFDSADKITRSFNPEFYRQRQEYKKPNQ